MRALQVLLVSFFMTALVGGSAAAQSEIYIYQVARVGPGMVSAFGIDKNGIRREGDLAHFEFLITYRWETLGDSVRVRQTMYASFVADCAKGTRRAVGVGFVNKMGRSEMAPPAVTTEQPIGPTQGPICEGNFPPRRWPAYVTIDDDVVEAAPGDMAAAAAPYNAYPWRSLEDFHTSYETHVRSLERTWYRVSEPAFTDDEDELHFATTRPLGEGTVEFDFMMNFGNAPDSGGEGGSALYPWRGHAKVNCAEPAAVEWTPSTRWNDTDMEVMPAPSDVWRDKLPDSRLRSRSFKQRVQRFVCTGEYKTAPTAHGDRAAAFYVGVRTWREFK